MGQSEQAEVDYFIKTIDKDNDKRISREEFVNYLRSF
jgi:Ca2+-binding EF-hand superfamily protein